MSVNAYIARGTNPGAGALSAAETKYNMQRDQQIRSRNAYVQDRAFNADQQYRNAMVGGQQDRALTNLEQQVADRVSAAPDINTALAEYDRAFPAFQRLGGNPEEFATVRQSIAQNWKPRANVSGTQGAFFNEMVRNGQLSPEDMVRASRIELGLDPRATGNAAITIASGNAGVTPQQVGESEGAIAAGKKAGEQAISMSGEMIASAQKVRASMQNIDRAINAIDKGANYGVVSNIFPSFRAATLELENAANRMGLDVIGSVTFGALSEGEMKLAMITAVPELPPAELKTWLQSYKAAQAKLLNELERAAIDLGKGMTPAEWMEKNATKKSKNTDDLPDDFDSLLQYMTPEQRALFE